MSAGLTQQIMSQMPEYDVDEHGKKEQHTFYRSLDGLNQFDARMVAKELSKYKTDYTRATAKYWLKRGRSLDLTNIHDLFRLYYPMNYSKTFFSDIQRTDDPVLSSTTNFLNTTYGEQLFSLLDMTQSTWKFIPKTSWYRRGWRYVDARHATGGGVAENSALPDTDQATTKVASAAPKTIIHTFDASLQAILEGQRGDDTWGDPIEGQRPIVQLEHGKDINGYFYQDFDTLASNNVESFDRLTSTAAAQSALSYDAADDDIYGINKGSTSSLDVAYIDHNSGTDRDFSLKRLDDMYKSVRRYWTNSPGAQPVWITGETTYERWNRELQPQQRFDANNNPTFTGGLNGIQYDPTGNIAGGFELGSYRTWNGKPIPIAVDPDVATDTIDRVYLMLMGQNATCFDVLMPTMYYENGMSNGNPFLLDKLGTEGAFVTLGEMKCYNLRGNGQLRDLQ